MRVTLADAAHLAQVPERTLRRWAAGGRLTVVRRAGRQWVTLDEVLELKELRGNGGRLPRQPVMA